MDTDPAAAPPPWLQPHQARVVLWARRVVLLGVVAYVLSTMPGVRHGSGYDNLLDGWLSTGVIAGASVLVFVRVAYVRTDRLAWALIGTSIAVYAFGDVAYAGWVQYASPVPYPSLADAGWLVFYPFAGAGLLLLLRRRITVSHPSMWVDGLVGMLGVAGLASMASAVILRDVGGSTAAIVTTVAYPLCDLLLLVLVVGAYGVFGWRPDKTWLLLGIGLVTYAAADTAYLLRVATGTYRAGTMLDPMWAVGYALTAFAAVARSPERKRVPVQGWWVLFVPALFTVSSLGLLVYGSVGHVSPVTVWLAAACVACGLGRTALTFREVQVLADSRAQARTDELTGLGNRRGLWEALEANLRRLAPGERTGVLIVDLDRFKEVNDSLGHHVGDQLLIEVGARLTTVVRADDVLVRLGGDEFAVALRSTTERGALALAERVGAEMQRAFVLDGVVVHIAASIGVALAPDVASDVGGLVQRADIAMYQAKSDRIGCVVYEASDDDDLRRRLRLATELRGAIDGDQLLLHYQPKADLRTGEVVSVEALVRWQHPRRGLVMPDEFIPEAERAGYMRLLTSRVLGLATDQAAVWAQAGTVLPIAVNISASNLLDVELPRQVTALLASRGLPPSALVLEITESTLMLDRTRSLAVLNELRANGVKISVDDYGTGYSSLAYLRDLPVDELKLDRTFTMHLDTDARAAAIVESTVRLAHSLGLPLVAEGIEDAETWERLASYGCDFGQGYYLSRPVPPEQIAAIVAAYSR
jgi:diguanylate cyclase (GGDEF)-like protein